MSQPFELYQEDSEESASLYDICEWVIQHYPEDIFTGESGDRGAKAVVRLRTEAKCILGLRNKGI